MSRRGSLPDIEILTYQSENVDGHTLVIPLSFAVTFTNHPTISDSYGIPPLQTVGGLD